MTTLRRWRSRWSCAEIRSVRGWRCGPAGWSVPQWSVLGVRFPNTNKPRRLRIHRPRGSLRYTATGRRSCQVEELLQRTNGHHDGEHDGRDPRMAASKPYTTPLVTLTSGEWTSCGRWPLPARRCRQDRAAQFGSVNGFPGMGDDITGLAPSIERPACQRSVCRTISQLSRPRAPNLSPSMITTATWCLAPASSSNVASALRDWDSHAEWAPSTAGGSGLSRRRARRDRPR